MCKISVITPVYKVEQYLEKCIDSILQQTFTDFELFIVDDGSPDLCGVIADKYARSDSRVHVIHKKNGGAASARNAGIVVANGDYCYFPDSDDWLEPNYLQELYDLAIETDAQLIISGFIMEYVSRDSTQSYAVSTLAKNYDNKKQVRENIHQYFNNMMIAVPWNKLYRTDYIREKGILFPSVKWDDLHFNLEVIKDIDKIAISNSTGYHFFRSRPGSETTQVFDSMLYSKRKEQFEHILSIYNYWKVDDAQIMGTIYGYYFARLLECIQEIAIGENRAKRKIIQDVLNDDLSENAVRFGKIDSKLLSVACIPIKMKNATICLILGKLIGFAKLYMSSFYYKRKSISVNKAKAK